MPLTARCSTLPPAALMITILWLTVCAMVGSETSAPCPPLVEYTADVQPRADEGAEALREGAFMIRMLSDHAVLRDRARALLKAGPIFFWRQTLFLRRGLGMAG